MKFVIKNANGATFVQWLFDRNKPPLCLEAVFIQVAKAEPLNETQLSIVLGMLYQQGHLGLIVYFWEE